MCQFCVHCVLTMQATWQQLHQQPTEEQVLLREWLPQNDLLGSGRLAAFVTQGGYLSMQVRHCLAKGFHTAA
jgi:hypothetical protein